MPLTAGTRLGPYEITSALGAGGMGEVYRATDTRLARTVAIKVLPPLLANDPQFRERFEREARAVSQLNHPHICTLHDVGEQDGTAFLVMEHLEGETLADRIAKGPVPIAQVLEYALQIADALDKAHRQGIIHRDLKPANVMLVRGGSGSVPSVCKLLDFGLAKIGAVVTPATVETRMISTPSPSAGALPLTAQGSILGTFQYMAPEQIEGQDADPRADIWAFGCVLYEMATGKRPFEGKTQASLIAAILEREPRPLAELQPMTPPALGRVVRTCLAKDPNDRFQTAHDLRLQLQWIEEGGSAAGLPAPVIAHRRHRERAAWLAITAAVALASAAAAWWLKPAPSVASVVSRFEYLLADTQRFTRFGRRSVTISPDGTKIVYVAQQQLYLRSLDQLEAQPIRGSDQDPLEPVFSPDGQWIAYFVPPKTANGPLSLRKISVGGGAPVPLTETEAPLGATWSGNTIVFARTRTGQDTEIAAVADSGGPARVLLKVPQSEGRATQPQLIDEGRRLLFNVGATRDTVDREGSIVVQNVDGGSRVVLIEDGRHPRRLPSGHLAYVQKGTMFVVPVDWNRLVTTGGAVPAVEGVAGGPASWASHYDVSTNGTLVYRPGAASSNNELTPVWVDNAGREQPVSGARPRAYERIRLSPDGTKVAMAIAEDENDIWVWDFARETMARLTFGAAIESAPMFSLDSRYVIFLSTTAPGQGDIFRKAVDGSGAAEALTKGGTGGEPLSFSPDGRTLVFRTTPTPTNSDLMIVSLDGGAPKPLLANPDYREAAAMISPDGRWLAYESNETGTPDIYVRPFPNVHGGRWQISDGGGIRPIWERAGRALLYTTTVENFAKLGIMSVTVKPGPAFSYDRPQRLFGLLPYAPTFAAGNYDVDPAGRFFLMKGRNTPADVRDGFVVVSNWLDELRARAR